MSIKSKVLAAVATLTMIGGVSTVDAFFARAATPACGPNCISVFSRELGTYTDPNFVEDVFGGRANVGQLVGLKRASGSDSSEDIMGHPGLVSDFYAKGMVSAEVNRHYGTLTAAQLEYAPLGMPTGLCVGLASVAYQREVLTLQPCSVPALTVWILDTADSPATAADHYFPIVNASTTDFCRPFAMSYPRHVDTTDETLPPIRVRHLRFRGHERNVPDTQLWGTYRGVLQ